MEHKNIDNSKKSLITQQEMVLIKNSIETTNTELYGNLYNCIGDYKKLSKAELDDNVVFDKKARAVLLNPENKKVMLNKIMEEWYSVKNFDVVDTLINCQLCGTPNKYIFYIYNKFTEVNLHIGSDCVRNYSDIVGIKQQKKNLSRLQREHLRQKRKIEFEALEGKEIGFIEDAENKFNEFPILLPYKLQNEIKNVLNQLNLSKSSYIKSGGNLEEIYDIYSILKVKFNDLYKQAENRYNEINDVSLVCDKETANWLIKNNITVWEKVSKNGGIFNAETLAKVYAEGYIDKKIREIMTHSNDKDIRVLQISKSNIHFLIKNHRYVYAITFMMPIKKFMERIGCNALTNKHFIFEKKDLQDISIEITSNNFKAVYNCLLDMLNKKGYDFIVEEKTSQAYWKKLPQNERKNKWSNHVIQVNPMYKKSSITLFLNTFSPFLLRDEIFLDKNFDIIIKNMESGKAWITQKEKNDYEEAAKYTRGMQRQREYIPY